jgi:hypothetical protein
MRIELTREMGWVTVPGGALTAITDFQVVEGECRMTTEAVTPETRGFLFSSLSVDGSAWQCGVGRTVRLRTDTRALVIYEVLG